MPNKHVWRHCHGATSWEQSTQTNLRLRFICSSTRKSRISGIKLIKKACSPTSVWNQWGCAKRTVLPCCSALCLLIQAPTGRYSCCAAQRTLPLGGWARGQRCDSHLLLLCTVTCSGEKNYCGPLSLSGGSHAAWLVSLGSRWYWVICFLHTYDNCASFLLSPLHSSQDISSHSPAVQRSKGDVSLWLVVVRCY